MCSTLLKMASPASAKMPKTTAEMSVAFYTAVAAMGLLFALLWRFELASKNARFQLRALRRKLGGDEASYSRSAAPRMIDAPEASS